MMDNSLRSPTLSPEMAVDHLIAEEVPQFEARSVDRVGNQEVPWATVRLRPLEVDNKIYLPFLQR